MSSRKLYDILENEFIVCVGFSNLLGDLLDKLNIRNYSISVGVDSSYDDAFYSEPVEGIEKSTKRLGHDRRYSYIKDEKYGIDGFYIADPTWDNNLEADLYNYLALTDEEITKNSRYNWISIHKQDELFNIKSIEEFYQKLNFLLARNQGIFNSLGDFITRFLDNTIKKLDPNFVYELYEKYPDYAIQDKEATDLLNDVAEYILNHVNKEISGNTIIDAVTNVYRHAYNYKEEDLLPTIQRIIEDNKERQEIHFYKRYQTDSKGNREVIMNEHNKFAIDSQMRSR